MLTPREKSPLLEAQRRFEPTMLQHAGQQALTELFRPPMVHIDLGHFLAWRHFMWHFLAFLFLFFVVVVVVFWFFLCVCVHSLRFARTLEYDLVMKK